MAEVEELCLRSSSPEATAVLAEALGRRVQGGTVISIDGDLGAGKTLFVKGLARGLEIDETVDSPTFTLMKEYRGRLQFFHCDAWMQGRERSFLEGEGEDCLHGDGVTAIEWGSRVRDLLPQPLLGIELAHLAPEQRRIRLFIIDSGAEDAGPQKTALQQLLRGLMGVLEHPDLALVGPGGEDR